MHVFSNTFEESMETENVDGNLSSYEQFKLDKLCRIEMARYVEQIEFSGVLSVCL